MSLSIFRSFTVREHTWISRSALLALLLIATAPLSQAEIDAGTLTGGTSFDNGGIFLEISAPAEIGNNPFDDDNVRAFNETQNLELVENLIMDVRSSDIEGNVLAPGSVVSSHYVIYDPASSNTAIGTVTFDEPVLGVIISTIRFNGTDDLLGNPGTNYSIGGQSLGDNDSVSISGNSINYDFQTSFPGDAIRVITGTDPVLATNPCGGADQTITGTITGGDALIRGGEFVQLCDPIGPVGDNNFDSYDLFAFEEQQAVELDAPLALDTTAVIDAGEIVSSYYVVWDPVPTNDVLATLTFPDTIIGVITQQAELQASEFLGDASAVYLNPNLLGLESGDTVTVNGASIDIDFRAGSPGDSVRVILGSASPTFGANVCDPADVTLQGSVTGGSAAANGGIFKQLCDPIGPVGNDNYQANDLFAFEEQQNVTLGGPLLLDDPVNTSVPAGTVVSSYYVAFDPGASREIVGTVTFPGQILGLSTSVDTLTASDSLGNATAVYLNPGLRGLEGADSASFAGDTLSVDFGAQSPGDYIRVFVAAPDTDSDGISDATDNCISVANPAQQDTDADNFGNACDADFNNDCVINVVDLGYLRSVFFDTDELADLNGDGIVNAVDLGILRSAFFMVPGPSGFGDCVPVTP